MENMIPSVIRIPQRLKLGGFEWEIIFSSDISQEGDVFGSSHYETQRIFIKPGMKSQKTDQCFLHELLHAMIWQGGLHRRFKSLDDEEDVVQCISMGLYQILKDNPDLVMEVL